MPADACIIAAVIDALTVSRCSVPAAMHGSWWLLLRVAGRWLCLIPQARSRRRGALVMCLARVRCCLFEQTASGTSPVETDVLERIAQLYAVEADIRGQSADVRRVRGSTLSYSPVILLMPTEASKPCLLRPVRRQADGSADSADAEGAIRNARADLALCNARRQMVLDAWPRRYPE